MVTSWGVRSSGRGGRECVGEHRRRMCVCSRFASRPAEGATRTGNNVTLRLGETAILRCYLEGHVGRVAWLNRSSIVFAGSDKWSSDPRVTLVGVAGGGEYSLRVAQLTPRDEGTYTCSVQTPSSGPHTTHYHLIVQVPPRITNISGDVTVNEGANVTISCWGMGQPEPSITWRHLSPAAKDDEYEGEFLEIEGISRDQAGEYQCSATNDIASTDTRKVRVTVNYPPSGLEVRSNGMLVGRLGSLRCEAAAVPLPSFLWFKENKRLQDGVSGVSIRTEGRRSTLSFHNVTELHYGNYTCQATNPLGLSTVSLLATRSHSPSYPTPIQAGDSYAQEDPSSNGHQSPARAVAGLVLVLAASAALSFSAQ
ncbi:limbic system-associated membrane protein-like isoform X1 [Petromyzon marinus]|uniref:limbic system-associated membrane protein-like isoform X1 n=1 Tax=Petromyzon marinus TaxID=7757 RepID=UPI003F719231